MWIVLETDESQAYRASAYMDHIVLHLSSMKPENLAADYYSSDKNLDKSKMEDASVLSINDMLKNSKGQSSFIRLLRESGVPYLNMRTVANFWSDVSPFAARMLEATELSSHSLIYTSKDWDIEGLDWQQNLGRNMMDFSPLLKTYQISYQKETVPGISVSDASGKSHLHCLVGNCQVFTYKADDDRLPDLLERLRSPAPVIWPLQPGAKEGTVAVTVVDIKIIMSGAEARQPFYNVLKATEFNDPKVNLAEFEQDFRRKHGIKPENANSFTGSIFLSSFGTGSSFNIITESRLG